MVTPSEHDTPVPVSSVWEQLGGYLLAAHLTLALMFMVVGLSFGVTVGTKGNMWWVGGVTIGLTCLLLIVLAARSPRGQRGRDGVLTIIAVALNVAVFAGFSWLVDWLNIPPEVIEALAK